MDANDTITVDGKEVLRFHPLNRKIKDGIPRCIACGQIDEDGFHEAQWCPGAGGYPPFATSTIKIKLKSDTGFRSETDARITLGQWILINRVLNGDDDIARLIVDQDGREIGRATTGLREIINMEAYVDENGTAWTPPTAQAYYAVCQAIKAKDARIIELFGETA